MRRLSPKQFFLLLYLLTGAGILTAFLLMNLDVVRLIYGLPFFLLPFPIILATFFVIVAIPRMRIAFGQIEIPRKYSPKHFLLLLWLSGQAFLINFMLHNGVYALGIFLFGWDFWGGLGDEPVFFLTALIIVPAGLVAGAFGRLWDWCITQPVEEMKVKGIQLPTTWGYFAPFASYGWLWKYSKGIEAITYRRIRAAGVFAAVFFLGIIGFIIIRYTMHHRLEKA
jgi:hypothetical protein